MTLWRQILSFVEILNLNKYMYLYENLQIIIHNTIQAHSLEIKFYSEFFFTLKQSTDPSYINPP